MTNKLTVPSRCAASCLLAPSLLACPLPAPWAEVTGVMDHREDGQLGALIAGSPGPGVSPEHFLLRADHGQASLSGKRQQGGGENPQSLGSEPSSPTY